MCVRVSRVLCVVCLCVCVCQRVYVYIHIDNVQIGFVELVTTSRRKAIRRACCSAYSIDTKE